MNILELMKLRKTPAGNSWNVTPLVETVTATLTFPELAGVTYNTNTGVLALDLPSLDTGSPMGVGVGKSGILASMIPEGETVEFGLQVETVPGPSTAYLLACFLADDSHTAAEMQLALRSYWLTGSAPFSPEPLVLSMCTGFVGNYTAAIINRKVTSVETLPDLQTISNESPPPVLPETGNHFHVKFKKQGGNLYFTQVSENQTGTVHELLPVRQVGDAGNGETAVFPDTMTICFAMLTYDTGSGFQAVSMKPEINVSLSSYTVEGTRFATRTVEGGLRDTPLVDGDWSAIWGAGNAQMVSQSVTQAVLPEGTVADSLLNTTVDEGYVGPAPAPYGVTLSDAQLVYVDQVTPSVVIKAIEDVPTAVARVADLQGDIAVVGVNLELLQTTVSDLDLSVSAQIAALQTALQSTATKTDEIRVYVRGASNNDGELSGLGGAVFDTFDEAYEYLATFPALVPKRIIFDDRDYSSELNKGLGVVDKTYQIVAKNITISTLRALNGAVIDFPSEGMAGSIQFKLRIKTDGLRFDHFHGVLWSHSGVTQLNEPWMFRLAETVNRPGFGASSENAFIGDNCAIWFDQYAMNQDNGGNIQVGSRCFLAMVFYPWAGTMGSYINITKPADSVIVLTGTVAPVGISGYAGREINVYTPYSPGSVIKNGDMVAATAVFYTGPRTVDVVNNAVVCRKIDDLAAISGGVAYLSPGTYFIVGELDFGDNLVRYPYGSSATLILLGTEGSAIRCSGHALDCNDINPNVIIRGVDLICNQAGYAALNSVQGNFNLKDVRLHGTYPTRILGSGAAVTSFIAEDIEFAGVSGGNVTQPPQMYGISKIRISGLRAKMEGMPLITITADAYTDVLIEEVEAYYPTNSFNGLIEIGSNYNIFVPPDDSIVVRDYRVMIGSGPAGFSLFSAGSSPVDHTSLDFIRTDNDRPFVDWESGTTNINGVINDPVFLSMNGGGDKSRFSSGSTPVFTFKGQEPVYFDVEATFEVSCSAASIVTYMGMWHGFTEGANPGNKLVDFPNQNEVRTVTLRRLVKLTSGESLGFYLIQTNGGSGAQFTFNLTNIRIRQV